MLIKTLLNKVEHFKSFIFGDTCLMEVDGLESVIIEIKPRKNGKPECPEWAGWLMKWGKGFNFPANRLMGRTEVR